MHKIYAAHLFSYIYNKYLFSIDRSAYHHNLYDFKIMRIMRILGKSNYFLMTSFPVRMTSSGADFLRHERSWVELLGKINRYRIGRTSWAPHFPKVTPVFNFRH